MSSLAAYLIFGLLTVIWGSNFILMKKASLAYGPLMISFSRVALGAIVLWIVFAVRERSWPFSWRDLWKLSIPAVVGAVLPYSILPWLIERHGSGLIGMMIGLVPIMTIIVSIPILNIRPGKRPLIGVAGGLGFLILLMNESLRNEIPIMDMSLAVVVPLFYAIANTWIKRTFPDKSPLALSCAVLTISGVILMPLVFILPWPILELESPHMTLATAALVTNGILATGAATLGFYILIQDRGPLFAGLIAYLIPFGAIIWGWIDGESVTPVQLVSIAGILSMVAYVEWENYLRMRRGQSGK